MFSIYFVRSVLLISVFHILKLTDALTNMSAKIIAGHYTSIEDYPYAVFLTIVRDDGYLNLCGSSILNQFLLLSAAHCFDNADPNEDIWAYAGSSDSENMEVTRKVVKAYTHEEYRQEDILHDIALLVLRRHLPLGKNIQRIFIKPHQRIYSKLPSMYVAGWGLSSEEPQKQSIYLKAVDQKMRSPQVCRQVIHRPHPGMFCAGSPDRAGRPSLGDSGSGIVTENYQLLGILSFKSEDNPYLPFYTSIAYYFNWIIRHSEEAQAEYCSYHRT